MSIHPCAASLLAMVSLLVVAAGCRDQSQRQANSPPLHDGEIAARSNLRFEDVTAATGIVASYDNGEAAGHRSIVESLGGGLASFDFDGDGMLDFIFAGGGKLVADVPPAGLPSSLWRQVGRLRYTDVTSDASVVSPSMYSHGVATADIDGDGFTDVLVTGYGGLQLLCNQGDGSFVDRTTEFGLVDDSWSSSAAWFDLEGDGDLDLYVTHYVDWSWENHPTCPASKPGLIDICSPNDFAPLPDVVYVNQGNGKFEPSSRELGLEDDGKGLGVVAAHLNSDNHIDLYVANDTRNNFLYLNGGDHHLKNVGLISGTAVDADGTPNGSMGIAVFDYDNDLSSDIWVTNYENETCALYQNTRDANFLWATERAGINALGKLFVSFGTVAGDFDSDGDEDLVVANGHIMHYPRNSTLAQESLLLENHLRSHDLSSAKASFSRTRIRDSDYFSTPHRGRGLVTGDFDLDGDLDLAFSNINESVSVLENTSGRQGRSLLLRLVGRQSNRDAIGARVTLHSDKSKYFRQIVGGGSYLSQNPYELHFAIPDGEQFQRLEISWPNGRRQMVGHFTDAQSPQLVIEAVDVSATIDDGLE